MNADSVLGLPLDEALRRLGAAGVRPTVVISRAPRRQDDVGALRVVRAQEGGARLTACAFITTLKEPSDG